MKMPDMRNLTRGALFLALGVVLPMAFHMAGGPSVGRVLLPMHIPVLLCGFFCGPGTGFLVGTITPLLSGVLTGMPPFMPPTAQIMMWELGTYGLLTGLLYRRARLGVYPALLVAMVSGRLVYGLLGYFFVYPCGRGTLSGSGRNEGSVGEASRVPRVQAPCQSYHANWA